MSEEGSLTILIVDDEDIVRTTLARMVDHFGHVAAWAENGLKGKDKLQQGGYDLAFVDMRMPGLDGLSLLKWVVAEQQNLPIIIMSGHGEQDAEDEALREGAYAFLYKPFSMQQIKQIIQDLR